jgi:hypothetical protein
MFRKYLFSGLMLALVAVIVTLVLKGRQQEKRQAAARVVEILKQYKPTATRIIAPDDLELVLPGGETGSAAPSRFSIRNRGKVTYANPEIDFVYLGKGDKPIETRTMKVEKAVPPGEEVPVGTSEPQPAPEGTRRVTVRIRSAEITK